MGDFNFFYNKPNNLQYLSSGAVSGSSRTSRLKYNQLSHTPVITSRERTLKAIPLVQAKDGVLSRTDISHGKRRLKLWVIHLRLSENIKIKWEA